MRVHRTYVLLGTLILFIIILVGGVLAYSRFSKQENTQQAPVATEKEIDFYDFYQDPDDPPITPFRDLNEKILMLPQSTASAQEKKNYISFVSKYASAQNSVDIKNCAPKPLVIWVKSGSDITIKNSDSDAREISVNDQHSVTVPANSSAKIKADFGAGPGVYAYYCGESEGPVGLFLVSSE